MSATRRSSVSATISKPSLEAARGRIAALEESRNQIANRIDWVIESLQGLVENGD